MKPIRCSLMVDPPVAGSNVTFADAGEQPTLTLSGLGLESYTFINIE